MALAANELFASQSRDDFPRVQPRAVFPKSFAPVAGPPTYPVLTPVVFDTSTNTWKVWTSGGANGTGTILGFLYPDPLTVDTALDMIANVLIQGEVHFDDIPVPTGETLANLKSAVRSGPRAQGLLVTGLDQVR